MLVPSRNSKYDWLAYMPTMVVPEIVQNTRNPYWAFLYLLVTVSRHNMSEHERIRTVVVSSLCKGCGEVSGRECARRMRLAYETVFERSIQHDWMKIWPFQHRLLREDELESDEKDTNTITVSKIIRSTSNGATPSARSNGKSGFAPLR